MADEVQYSISAFVSSAAGLYSPTVCTTNSNPMTSARLCDTAPELQSSSSFYYTSVPAPTQQLQPSSAKPDAFTLTSLPFALDSDNNNQPGFPAPVAPCPPPYCSTNPGCFYEPPNTFHPHEFGQHVGHALPQGGGPLHGYSNPVFGTDFGGDGIAADTGFHMQSQQGLWQSGGSDGVMAPAVYMNGPPSAPAPWISTVSQPQPSCSGSSPTVARAIAAAQNQKRPRSEKKPIPSEQKDNKYYERRKRNNQAAKKSRDARKAREDEIAIRASFLEKENAILRAQTATLREEAHSLKQLLMQKTRQRQ